MTQIRLYNGQVKLTFDVCTLVGNYQTFYCEHTKRVQHYSEV